jgi:hypothetical protein
MVDKYKLSRMIKPYASTHRVKCPPFLPCRGKLETLEAMIPLQEAGIKEAI